MLELIKKSLREGKLKLLIMKKKKKKLHILCDLNSKKKNL